MSYNPVCKICGKKKDVVKKKCDKQCPCPLETTNIYTRPKPPFLPRNFSWCGHYFVPDLNLDVPFTWNGNNGNMQMTAGSIDYPIWFTNLIYDGFLYTFTYKWPGLVGEQKCDKLFPFTMDDLNTIFASASYVGEEIITSDTICSSGKKVGAEIIEQNKKCLHVHHFRLAIALPRAPPGNHFRLPITSADIYVDKTNPSKFWKVLHFGFQNIYDPNLDEWIYVNEFKDVAGEINLPPECVKVAAL